VGEAAPGTGIETAVTPVNGGSSPYVFVSPDGSRAFFASRDQLTESAPNDGAVKEYEFDLGTEEMTYLSELAEPAAGPFSNVIASSQDGSSLLFENAATQKIELLSGGTKLTEVASFSTPSAPEFSQVRSAKDGSAFVFGTNAVLEQGTQKFNNSSAQLQIYRYETSSGSVSCLSCAPTGTAQSAAFGKHATGGHVLADEGKRVFFSTAEKLLPQDVNGVEDVYEWEQEGAGSCPPGQAAGCTFLISSGTDSEPSFYLDSSESGDDVFIATKQGLLAEDTDESYDVYDARIGGGFPHPVAPAECADTCQGAAGSFAAPVPLTTAAGPVGNLPTPAQSGPATAPKPKAKPPTRAQKLARALKACRKRPKRKRASCKERARRLYGKKTDRRAK
jgi:hypothetical protein